MTKCLALHEKQLLKGIQIIFCAEIVQHMYLALFLPSLCRSLITEELCFNLIRIGSIFYAKHLLSLRQITGLTGKFCSQNCSISPFGVPENRLLDTIGSCQ